MNKISSNLWFDNNAKEASQFYLETFGMDSKIYNTTTLLNTPSGNVDVIDMRIWDHDLTLISAGPIFKFNPSISFMVNFDPVKNKDAAKKIDEVWQKLLDGGEVFMPLDKYPWSERYGWIKDKFGMSWQLILTKPEGEEKPSVIPTLLFVKESYGKAKEAADFYLSVFKNSKMGSLEPNEDGTTLFSDFKLENQWFVAMDGKGTHNFSFNESISFVVRCENQEEIDYYFEKLSAVPEAEQCGWLKDKFGISWQIVPKMMDELMKSNDREKINRVTEAFLKMKKFNIQELERTANMN